MSTFSTRSGDRIYLGTLGANGVSLTSDVTVRVDPGAIRPGFDMTGELRSESAAGRAFFERVLETNSGFQIHIDPVGSARRRSAIVARATDRDGDRLEWIGSR